MADFTQTIESKYGIGTYQETKNTYDWIMKAVVAGNYSDMKIREQFFFKIGDISCSCKSIAEYVENAYGQNDFSLTNIDIHIFHDETENIYFCVYGDGKVWVTTGSRVSLNKIIELLESTVLASIELNDSISVAYIENQNNGVVIQGNENIVANANSTIKSELQPQDSKWKQFFGAVIQNIVANWIGYLIIAMVTALVTFFAIK